MTVSGVTSDMDLLPVCDSIADNRSHRLVIGRLRLQAVRAHAECRLRMAPVDPDVRFRRLAQLRWVRAVINDGEMIIRPSGVVGGPSDNGEVVAREFERRPLDDLTVPAPLSTTQHATTLLCTALLGA